MEAVLERGHNAEVAAWPRRAQKRSACSSSLTVSTASVGGHELRGEEVVDGEAVLGHEEPEPSTEGQARDPRRGDRASGDGEPVELRLAVELCPRHTALRTRGAGRGIDMDPLHRREVDHQTSVGDRPSGDVVAATANRHLEGALTSRRPEPSTTSAVPPQRAMTGRTSVDHAVLDLAGLVVALAGQRHEAWPENPSSPVRTSSWMVAM